MALVKVRAQRPKIRGTPMFRSLLHPVLRTAALCLLLVAAPVVDVAACCCKLSVQGLAPSPDSLAPAASSSCCSSPQPKASSANCCAPQPASQPPDDCSLKTLDTCECCALATPFRAEARIQLHGKGSPCSAVWTPAPDDLPPHGVCSARLTRESSLICGNRRQALLCSWRN